MIKGTVALPIWNMKKITWLCLESLCRQKKPNNGWELIVFEGHHAEQIGEKFIRSYEERLNLVGCERIVFLTDIVKLPLPQKWLRIALESSETSEYFCMCAGDNYYQPFMLQDSENAIKEADWCIVTRGYFYDFYLKKIIKYHLTGMIGLQMTARTSYVREFPLADLPCAIDTWFATQMINVAHKRETMLRVFIDGSDHWENILCTNGLNNISKTRYKFFEDIHPPFYDTDKRLIDIVPEDISDELTRLSKILILSANESFNNSFGL
jgi:glycosyltransferase involved in cell wall biosynthesis